MNCVTIVVKLPTTTNESANNVIATHFESSKTLFGAGVDHTTGSIFTSRSRCIASPV
jgi:hypothetical protein